MGIFTVAAGSAAGVFGTATISGPFADMGQARTEWQRLTFRDRLGAMTEVIRARGISLVGVARANDAVLVVLRRAGLLGFLHGWAAWSVGLAWVAPTLITQVSPPERISEISGMLTVIRQLFLGIGAQLRGAGSAGCLQPEPGDHRRSRHA